MVEYKEPTFNYSISKTMIKQFFYIFLALLFMGCVNSRNVEYLKNSDTFVADTTQAPYEMTIKPKDVLEIYFFNPNNPNSIKELNVIERTPVTPGQSTANNTGTLYQYVVDNQGNIPMPVIGDINLLGLSKEQAEKKIHDAFRPYFSTEDIMVTVNMCNFVVSVAGEVNNPNVFTIYNSKVNIFEALAMAGDITITGKRDNVMLIRTESDGTKSVHTLDLTDANIINSPYYNLQQRDLLYVEPTDIRKQDSKVGTMTQVVVSGVSIAVSIGSLLYRILSN